MVRWNFKQSTMIFQFGKKRSPSFKIPSSNGSNIGSTTTTIQSPCTSEQDDDINTETVNLDGYDITRLAMKFCESRKFHVAVEYGIYTELYRSSSNGGLTHTELVDKLSLNEHLRPDFLDVLVSINVLGRTGNGPNARYINTPETELYLVKDHLDTYIGDFILLYHKLYSRWTSYPKSLQDEKYRCPYIRDMFLQQQHVLDKFKREKIPPNTILDAATSFITSRAVLAAFELGLFTVIEDSKKKLLSGKQIHTKLSFVDRRATYDLLDHLVLVHVLHIDKSEDGKKRYRNSSIVSKMVVNDATQSNIGFFIMSSIRLYKFWSNLSDAFITGFKQNEVSRANPFDALYDNPVALIGFMNAMSGITSEIRTEFIQKFDFTPYTTITDVGGGPGLLSIAIAENNPHITKCITTDLYQVRSLAEMTISAASCNRVQDVVQFVSSNFFEEDIPSSDLIVMSIILHEFPLSKKMYLLQKAYNALPENGTLVVIGSMIDNERRVRTYGLCMSVNMLIEFGVDGGFDYTEVDICNWCEQVGFARVEVQVLSKIYSMCIAHKN